jgi:hypothetical protein
MNRVLTFAAAAFLAATVSYGATVTNTVQWNVPWGDRFRERCVEVLDAVVAQLNADTTAIATALATNVTKGTVAQIDTNAVTSITTKTPGQVGQLLVGGAVAQYDALWYAKGATTNDWVRFTLTTGTLGATNITFRSTLQTNVLYFNTIGVLTNHVQTGP